MPRSVFAVLMSAFLLLSSLVPRAAAQQQYDIPFQKFVLR